MTEALPPTKQQAIRVAASGLHELEPWVVHVQGPDDVLPATGMLDAIRQAHSINECAVSAGGYYGKATEDRPFMTLVWAIPTKESWL